MKRREKLHEILVDTLGCRNVYFQPPENVNLQYPAIVYSLVNARTRNANNATGIFQYEYTVILIHKDPENDIVEKIIKLPYSRFANHFKSENLNHYVFTIYY